MRNCHRSLTSVRRAVASTKWGELSILCSLVKCCHSLVGILKVTYYMKSLVTKRDKRQGEKIELPPRNDRR